jgi:hypothetical protein
MAVAQERSLGELLKDLSLETGELFRKEVQLAKAEMSDKVARVGTGVGRVAMGGALAFAGALVLLYAVVTGLTALFAQFLPLGVAVWLAPLVLGGALAFFGWSRMQSALGDLKGESLAPRHTVETLEENKQWLKAKIQ